MLENQLQLTNDQLQLTTELHYTTAYELFKKLEIQNNYQKGENNFFHSRFEMQKNLTKRLYHDLYNKLYNKISITANVLSDICDEKIKKQKDLQLVTDQNLLSHIQKNREHLASIDHKLIELDIRVASCGRTVEKTKQAVYKLYELKTGKK